MLNTKNKTRKTFSNYWLLTTGYWLLFSWTALPAADAPRGELIFQPEHLHNHGSCIVECPNGDLLVCWYNGSGERNADDVKVEGARLRKGSSEWSPRFLLADTPGFPDTNPCMFVDPRGKLWLIWQAIVANQWHTAICKYKVSSDYQGDGPPRWEFADIIQLKPGPEFVEGIAKETARAEAEIAKLPAEQQARWKAYVGKRLENAKDKYFSRMGWMTRAHPVMIDDKRLLVPLYSDGYSVSLMGITDDWGATWKSSAPLVGGAGVQPSVVRRKDGSLLAYQRDNGPAPKRLIVSESKDRGETWTPNEDTELFNPASGAEAINLRNGRWLLIYNDTERGRHSLAVSLSDDEGKTWKWTKRLERNEAEEATFGYPSVIQAKDGALHASYTYTLKGPLVKQDPQGRPMRECIKHLRFTEEWIEGK